MNNILFDTKQLDNRMGTKRLNWLGTNRPSWVESSGYESSAGTKRLIDLFLLCLL